MYTNPRPKQRGNHGMQRSGGGEVYPEIIAIDRRLWIPTARSASKPQNLPEDSCALSERSCKPSRGEGSLEISVARRVTWESASQGWVVTDKLIGSKRCYAVHDKTIRGDSKGEMDRK